MAGEEVTPMQKENNGAVTKLIEQGAGDTWEAAATEDLPLLPIRLMTFSTNPRDTVTSVTCSMFRMVPTTSPYASLRSTGTDEIREY